jgi:hypothetical protein
MMLYPHHVTRYENHTSRHHNINLDAEHVHYRCVLIVIYADDKTSCFGLTG